MARDWQRLFVGERALWAQARLVLFGHALLEKLVHAGFDPVYGARPLKRAIQHKVENPLAQALLSGRIVPGKKLLLGADSNGLTMTQ